MVEPPLDDERSTAGAARRSTFEIGTDGPGLVVVGVDETDTARRAAAYAAGVARRHGGRMLLVYVRTVGAFDVLDPGAVAGLRESHDAVAAEVQALAVFAREQLGVATEFIELRGDAVAELTRLVVDRRADLLVLGRSHRRGHRIAGSVSARMVHSGLLPVTVVP